MAVNLGYGNPAVLEAMRRQMEKTTFAYRLHFENEPAEELARRLLARVGAPLAHVFYSDSGSTAVEVALKMALGYWRNRGETRTKILALEHSYHGDTVGTMSVA